MSGRDGAPDATLVPVSAHVPGSTLVPGLAPVPGLTLAGRLAAPARVMVTGAAGFIGAHVAAALAVRGHEVLGLDDLNDYYAVDLKHARLAQLPGAVRIERIDVADPKTAALAAAFKPRVIIHLAAQAGVRYSIENPRAYVHANVTGQLGLLEAARAAGAEHLVYASSSSVYGRETRMPFRTDMAADDPVSIYAATKRAGELLACAFAGLHGLRATGLRFFTVYGPWGRPDMAPMLFADAILNDRPIKLFNGGAMKRDFTYIADVVEGVLRLADADLTDAGGTGGHRLYNIGRGSPVDLMEFVRTLEGALGAKATLERLPMQPGDVAATWADVSDLTRDVGFAPHVDLDEGVAAFADWYRAWTRPDASPAP